MSSKTIVIEPVTRIEGEVKVVIFLDEKGNVKNAYYQVLEFRGFEAFCRGRPAEELPRITSAICGVCSWAHHLASGKALDMIYGRRPTPTASKLRELGYLAHIVDSHLLHFVVMALPDFTLESIPPELRNIVGILREEPRIVELFLKSRNLVRSFEEVFGGKAIHPAFVLPGGVSKKLTKEDWEKLNNYGKELLKIVKEILNYFRNVVLKSRTYMNLLHDEAYSLKTYYIGLVDEANNLNFYDGYVRIIDNKGREVAKFRSEEYLNHIAEHYEEWSYSKFPYLKTIGWKGFVEEYLCRAGPLARLNVADKIPSEEASEEFKYMVEVIGSKPIHNTMAYHWARLIESLHACEKIMYMLQDESILREDVVNVEGSPKYEGVGIVEAPRGTLIHHYVVDENFIAKDVNVITPTAINNAAINTELRKVASKIISGNIDESALNLVEASIRAYDPCNACATHYVDPRGRSNLVLIICDSNGNILKKISYRNRPR